MAAAHAGVKRTRDEMNDGVGNRNQSPSLSSRFNSPLPSSGTPSGVAQADARNAQLRAVKFDPSVSLVLIGIRGVGKSTLGVIAATAYHRRLVDLEKVFTDTAGITSVAFRKLHGPKEYQIRLNQVLKDTLDKYTKDAIIICSISDLENDGATLVREFAKTHPVIHVTRDAEGIQSYLRVWTTDRINQLLPASSKLLRSCSNYEFYNLSEIGDRDQSASQPSNSHQKEDDSPDGGFLTLKAVEHDFLKLLRKLLGGHNRRPSHQSAEPLSNVSLEDRERTYAVSIMASDILAGRIDLDKAQIGADCVELVVDIDIKGNRQHHNNIARAFAILRRSTILPVLIKVLKAKSNGQGPKDYAEILDHCLRLGPEMCNVDLSFEESHLIPLLACRGDSKILGEVEFSHRPDSGWDDVRCVDSYKRATTMGCDMVKITMPAQGVDDIFPIHAFRERALSLPGAKPLIAIASGIAGRSSKCFNNTLTGVKVPPDSSVSGSKQGEDDEMTAQEITKALFSSFMLQPLEFLVYGGNVEYSLSPAMHNAAYKECGLHYNYIKRSSDSLDEFKRIMALPTFGGAAMAQPFKTTVIQLLDGLSPHAKAIGAANTLVAIRQWKSGEAVLTEQEVITQRRRQGPLKGLYGFNTDWIGMRACIRRGLSPANVVQPWSSALVCGAGGMARAAIYSLISLGVRNIFVCNRTKSNALALMEHYNKLASEGHLSQFITDAEAPPPVRLLDSFSSSWPTDVRHPTIVLSCIPRKDPDGIATNFSLPDEWLKSPTGGVVVEVAYDFPVSPLVQQIRQAAHKGWIIMDGFDVIPEQAYSQFELFTGRRAPRKLMRDEIMKYYYPADGV